MTGFAYLQTAQLKAVRDAVTELGLVTEAGLEALSAGIKPAFVATYGSGGPPGLRLYPYLVRMNQTQVLVGGQVPLVLWLENAIDLAAERPEQGVLREALAAVSVDAAPANVVSIDDLDDLPTTPEGELEVTIGTDETLGVAFLRDGLNAARSIVRVVVHRHEDGQPMYVAGGNPRAFLGTGWLIAPGLLITNRHVIAARERSEAPVSARDFELQGRHTSVQFDYHQDGGPMESVPIVCCEFADAERDFAILRFADGPSDRPALRLRPQPLTRSRNDPLNERVNVLQHPGGRPMRLGFRSNYVVTADATRLSYLTDTAGGSSGSPVCDDEWWVAGLHRGWQPIEGRAIKVWGRRINQENYATPIGQVLRVLAERAPELRAEIAAGQAVVA